MKKLILVVFFMALFMAPGQVKQAQCDNCAGMCQTQAHCGGAFMNPCGCFKRVGEEYGSCIRIR